MYACLLVQDACLLDEWQQEGPQNWPTKLKRLLQAARSCAKVEAFSRP